MIIRIIAALVGLAIVVPALVWGGEIGFKGLIFVVCILVTDEFLRMVLPENKPVWPMVHLIYALAILAWMIFPEHALYVLCVSQIIMLLGSVVLFNDNHVGLRNAASINMGFLYIPFLLSQLVALRLSENGLTLIFFCLILTWAADSGAYFAGRAFGKHKLAPRVSPNKTWEGAIGGFLTAMVCALFINNTYLNIDFVHLIVLVVLLDIVSILGDLFESMLKRAVNVKDSGWIMPGHGGILDRIDSLLFTAPTAYVYLSLVGII